MPWNLNAEINEREKLKRIYEESYKVGYERGLRLGYIEGLRKRMENLLEDGSEDALEEARYCQILLSLFDSYKTAPKLEETNRPQ